MINNNENDLQKSSKKTEKSSKYKDLFTPWKILLSACGVLLMFIAVNYMLPVSKMATELDAMRKYEITRIEKDITENKICFEKLSEKFNSLENRIIVIETKVDINKAEIKGAKGRE